MNFNQGSPECDKVGCDAYSLLSSIICRAVGWLWSSCSWYEGDLWWWEYWFSKLLPPMLLTTAIIEVLSWTCFIFACPSLATLFTNTYHSTSNLFIEGISLLLQKGSKLHRVMPMHAVSIVPIIQQLSGLTQQFRYADDAATSGGLLELQDWCMKSVNCSALT